MLTGSRAPILTENTFAGEADHRLSLLRRLKVPDGKSGGGCGEKG